MEIKTIGTHDDLPVREAVLTNETGVRVSIISYGAIVRDWQVPVNGKLRSVVLGFKTFEPYLRDGAHLGAIVGRVANRIGGSKFTVGGKQFSVPANAGIDHLHGGPRGLGRRNWNLKASNETVTLTYHSPAGEMGYPGAVDFTVTYRLDKQRLIIHMGATVSELTPINMVQHQYFNLAGHGTILDHTVYIAGDAYTPLTDKLLPTGDILAVDNTPFDFRAGRTFRNSDGTAKPYDVNFSLTPKERKKEPVATVTAPDQSLTLRLWSDQPGVQLYTSEYLNSADEGLGGERYGQFGGLCLEDQMFPDALNHTKFPSILVSPEKPYSHWCEIEIK